MLKKIHIDLYIIVIIIIIMIIIIYCHHRYYFNGEFNPISLCLCTDIFYLLLKHTDLTLPRWCRVIYLHS